MIFLDMDGVLADFDGGFQKKFGVHPDYYRENKKGMWDLIHSDEEFFTTLPQVAGAVSFYEEVRFGYQLPIAILTACPHSAYEDVARQKKLWIRNNLRYPPMVLPTYGSETKTHFMQDEGDILIDDWGKNCKAWEDAGGRAIKFEGDWEVVKEKLIEYR
jgi:5'-nucleotidase